MTWKYRRDCFNSGEAWDSSGDLNGSQSPSRLIENVRISRSRGACKAPKAMAALLSIESEMREISPLVARLCRKQNGSGANSNPTLSPFRSFTYEIRR